MALKFLNKKGWHTGSLRNIENVWKAEQKHDAEQKKLEELRKQIHEERERSEFRQLQEQAGLVPRQERLDFLYESGLAVGKSADGFKALEAPTIAEAAIGTVSAKAGSSKATVPGALFEDKPQSSNDAWRKLHSDPLLLIREREQEALARIKNNPIQMSMIRKSVEAEKIRSKDDKGKREKKKQKRKHPRKVKNEKNSDSENTSESGDDRTKRKHSKMKHSSTDSSYEEEERRKSDRLASDCYKDTDSQHPKCSSIIRSDPRNPSESEKERRNHSKKKLSSKDSIEDEEDRSDRLASDRHKGIDSQHEKRSSRIHSDSRYPIESEEDRRNHSKRKHLSKDSSEDEEVRRQCDRHKDRNLKYENRSSKIRPNSTYEERRKHMPSSSDTQSQQGPGYNHRKGVPKMTEEERQARLREMQTDAELHEEQRWKRIKNAAEADAREAARVRNSGGKNFLDSAQKSIYGTEKGGRSTIEESVRRRAYYSQGGSAAHESNAFRR